MKKPELHYYMKCIGCEFKMPHDKSYYTCPKCGDLFLPERDEEHIARQVGRGRDARDYFDSKRYSREIRRYPFGSGVFVWLKHILPGFPKNAILSLREGFTDLFEPPLWFRREIGLPNLLIKMEGQNPSESFKDRGMPVAISEARRLQLYYPELNIKFVGCASTGDTSASASQYSAYYRDFLRCIVFVPIKEGGISSGQLAQAMMYGAIVVGIKHPEGFDGCMKLIQQFCIAHPEIVLVNSKNTFRLVGQETIALEIFQDLRWRIPNWIAIPVGNAGNLTALLLSSLRAKSLGLIDELPGIIVAQTESANTVVRWIRSGLKVYQPNPFKVTVASAMNIQDPVSFPRIRELCGKFEILAYDVSEEEIQRTRARFNRTAADICPQGAVALNAVLQAHEENKIKENDLVVAISTASGLKFVDSAIDYHLHSPTEELANPYLTEETGTIEGIEELLKSKL